MASTKARSTVVPCAAWPVIAYPWVSVGSPWRVRASRNLGSSGTTRPPTTEPEDQRLPLGGVVGSLVKPLDVLVEGAVAQLDSAGSRYGAGTLPAAVEVDRGPLHCLGSILPDGRMQIR
jgi:hypothetical protein